MLDDDIGEIQLIYKEQAEKIKKLEKNNQLFPGIKIVAMQRQWLCRDSYEFSGAGHRVSDSKPSLGIQKLTTSWEVAWELAENPETRSTRGKLSLVFPPRLLPQCDRKNCFMKGQNQETDDAQDNNLSLDVAIAISSSESQWPRKILTLWCQGQKTFIYA